MSLLNEEKPLMPLFVLLLTPPRSDVTLDTLVSLAAARLVTPSVSSSSSPSSVVFKHRLNSGLLVPSQLKGRCVRFQPLNLSDPAAVLFFFFFF